MYKKMFLIVAIVLIQCSCQSQEKKDTNQINFFQAFYEQHAGQNNLVRISFDIGYLDTLNKHYLPFFYYDALDKMQAYIYAMPKPNYIKEWKIKVDKIHWKNELDSFELRLIEKQDSMLQNFVYVAFVYIGKDIIETGNCLPDEFEKKGCRDEYEICDTCDLTYIIYILEKNNQWLKIGNFKATPKYQYTPKWNYPYTPSTLIEKLVRSRIADGKLFDDILIPIK